MVQTRAEVPKEDRWNVEAIYPSFEAWQEEFEKINRNDHQPKWPEILTFQGQLQLDPEKIKQTLTYIFEISRKIEKLYTWAHLKHDEDIANEQYKSAFSKIMGLYHEFAKETSWFEPELIAIENEQMESFLRSSELKEYRFYIEKIVRIRTHTLSLKEEKLMALAGITQVTPSKSFNAINDADFVFDKAKDSKGFEYEITHGSFGQYIRNQDPILRKNTFESLHNKYLKYENTLTELLNGQVQNHLFNARARHYNSCLEAALFPKNIQTEVYHSLIKATHEHIDALHKYTRLRKKALKLQQLHYYDLQVPLIQNVEIKMTYKEAEDIVIESVAPLGIDYQNLLKKGLKESRWVDRYENKNKRSGAYSSGCFDTMPYILMNYKKLLRDVFTLAHEAGHSMHSLLSRNEQPYWYADYPIFVAEVASTFNEDLLMRLMLDRAQSKEEKIFLINQKIDDIRATYYRQALFSEFELTIHQFAEQHIPLTPQLLKQTYRKLNETYFGPELILTETSDIEWARIPHFYYNFYVYQYATGISAALALTDTVINGGHQERLAYLNFLKSGSSLYPVDTLQLAGVDMRTPDPMVKTIEKFSKLVDELDKLLFKS